MLVLTRKLDEELIIGRGPEAIVIKVLSIRPEQIRLGIQAPQTTPIYRSEVYAAAFPNEPTPAVVATRKSLVTER